MNVAIKDMRFIDCHRLTKGRKKEMRERESIEREIDHRHPRTISRLAPANYRLGRRCFHLLHGVVLDVDLRSQYRQQHAMKRSEGQRHSLVTVFCRGHSNTHTLSRIRQRQLALRSQQLDGASNSFLEQLVA